MKKIFILLASIFVIATLTAKDIRTVTLTTQPQMHCANCETKIKNQLRFEKGVKRIDTNVEKQTIVIQYDAERISSALLIKSLPDLTEALFFSDYLVAVFFIGEIPRGRDLGREILSAFINCPLRTCGIGNATQRAFLPPSFRFQWRA